MWNKAIEDAIHKVGSNMANHPGKLPHIAEGQQYEWGDNDDWIEGFYVGMMWLAYEYSKDSCYKEAADLLVRGLQASSGSAHRPGPS